MSRVGDVNSSQSKCDRFGRVARANICQVWKVGAAPGGLPSNIGGEARTAIAGPLASGLWKFAPWTASRGDAEP